MSSLPECPQPSHPVLKFGRDRHFVSHEDFKERRGCQVKRLPCRFRTFCPILPCFAPPVKHGQDLFERICPTEPGVNGRIEARCCLVECLRIVSVSDQLYPLDTPLGKVKQFGHECSPRVKYG